MNTHTTGEFQTLATDDPLAAERQTLAEGTVLAGRYRIQKLIGEGGMGDVYLATHLKIGKEVAIKVLAPQQMRRPRTVSRFLQEAKAASKIRHENVVDITDYGESDGCAFFVMEYLRGEDLSVLLKRESRLPWSRIKPICTQVLRALSASHAAGIVHRDIKPHNCFVSPREDGSDQVKVIDFGIAKLSEGSEEQLTRTGAIMGTAEYMSPEQGMGSELDGRSDLYSVGIILYRMLTGSVPHKGNNPMAILYQHIHAERIPPSEACPEEGIGPKVDALVLKSLASERDDRYATAEEFIEAIEAIEDQGEGTVAPLPKRGAPRWLVPAAIGLLVAGVAAAVALRGGDEGSPAEQTEPSVAITTASPATTASTVAAAAGSAGDSGAAGDDESTGDGESTDGEPTDDATAASPESSGAEPAGDSGDGATTEATSSNEPSPASRPVRRSTRQLRSRLARVVGKVRACGKQAGLFPGESVTVRLKIAPNGRVQSAKVQGAFSRKGAACIEGVVRGVKFSEAQQTQTASHRFTL